MSGVRRQVAIRPAPQTVTKTADCRWCSERIVSVDGQHWTHVGDDTFAPTCYVELKS